MTTPAQPAGTGIATRPCQAGAAVPAPWSIVTSDDYHRRRPGEALGYVPEVGDQIRYALHHSPWCAAAQRMIDDHDEVGPFGVVVTVVDAVDGENGTRYTCRDAKGTRSWIDLDWWIVERHVEDGALW